MVHEIIAERLLIDGRPATPITMITYIGLRVLPMSWRWPMRFDSELMRLMKLYGTMP